MHLQVIHLRVPASQSRVNYRNRVFSFNNNNRLNNNNKVIAIDNINNSNREISNSNKVITIDNSSRVINNYSKVFTISNIEETFFVAKEQRSKKYFYIGADILLDPEERA